MAPKMKKKSKKILITGAAGFIGYFLIERLLRETTDRIVAVDNFQRGKYDGAFKAILTNSRVTFLKLDLTSPASYAKLGAGYEHVYHLAAINGTKNFYEMPDEVLRINTLTTVYILEWMKAKNKKGKILFTSSNEAYAGGLNAFGKLPIPTPEAVPLVVEDVYNPRWTYAGTKLIGEQFFIQYAQKNNFRAVIVRPHNFYGPRAGYDHVIPEFIVRISKRADPFPIFGADDTRTFCYITDAVEAMHMVMESSRTDKGVETFHIGNTDEILMRDLAGKLFDVAGWRPKKTDVHASPKGSVKRRLANISKIKKVIGWKPTTTLREGLAKTYEWYIANPKK